MKRVVALLCSLVLFLAPLLAAAPVNRCAARPGPACGRPCCQHGHPMGCCSASASRPVSPLPANTNRLGAQNEFALWSQALLTILAPLPQDRPALSPAAAPLAAATTALYARHCTRLI